MNEYDLPVPTNNDENNPVMKLAERKVHEMIKKAEEQITGIRKEKFFHNNELVALK